MHTLSHTPSIYQIRHVASGRVYVGSSVDPCRRCNEHRIELSRGVHLSRYLQNAWNKYGQGAFVFEIIEPVLFVEDLVTREQYWIDRLRAADRRYGFNIAPKAGSTLGYIYTEDNRRRVSEGLSAHYSDPIERARLSEQVRARMENPKNREWLSSVALSQWEDPAYIEKLRTGHARRRARVLQAYGKPIPESKVCPSCGEEKSSEAFGVSRRRGLQSACKECANKRYQRLGRVPFEAGRDG